MGWGLTVVVVLGLVACVRAIPTFVRETIRHDRGDGRWFVRWPKAVFTGRFARHEGKWDPGQRIANLVIVVGLLVMIVTGIGLVTLHGGHTFALMAKIHKWTALVLTAVLLGHVVIAAGVLPGYRGVWRSMHLGGRLRKDTAERVWPAWMETSGPADAAPASRPSEPSSASDVGTGVSPRR
jgi:formate dehydrogenase subunit gamma